MVKTVRELIEDLLDYDMDSPVHVVIDSEKSYPFITEDWAPKYHVHGISGAYNWSHTAGVCIALTERKE